MTGGGHLSSVRRGEENHPIVSHFLEHHGGAAEPGDWEMKVLGFEDKNLHRQAREGHLISNFKGNYIMNGRGDWGQNLPPKLEVEGRSSTPFQ